MIHFELEFWSNGAYSKKGWHSYSKDAKKTYVCSSLQEAESLAKHLVQKYAHRDYRIIEVQRRAVRAVTRGSGL